MACASAGAPADPADQPQCPRWVKSGKARPEQMLSVSLQ